MKAPCTRRQIITGLSTLAICGTASLHPAQAQTIQTQAAALRGAHPAEYYKKAKELFQAGQKNEAVFMFYLGQLAYRSHLQARAGELQPDGDAALFASLSEVIGRPVNEYAFGDIPALTRTLDDVLAFDAAKPDAFTPPAKYAAIHQKTRAGLASMRVQLVQQAASIRAQRTANGLENRNVSEPK